MLTNLNSSYDFSYAQTKLEFRFFPGALNYFIYIQFSLAHNNENFNLKINKKKLIKTLYLFIVIIFWLSLIYIYSLLFSYAETELEFRIFL